MSRKLSALLATATLGVATATAATVGVNPAFADSNGGNASQYSNIYVATYATSAECAQVRDYSNRAHGYPINDQYYYCGGSGDRALWFRVRNY